MHDEHDRDPISERLPGKVGVDLAALADQINAEHEACGAAMTTGLEHAIRAGEMLLEAKHGVAHGDWTGWLKANVAFSVRTAQGYMRVARKSALFIETPINPQTGKTQRVAGLSLRDTLQALAVPTAKKRRALNAATATVPATKKPAEERAPVADAEIIVDAEKIMADAEPEPEPVPPAARSATTATTATAWAAADAERAMLTDRRLREKAAEIRHMATVLREDPAAVAGAGYRHIDRQDARRAAETARNLSRWFSTYAEALDAIGRE